MSTKYKDYPIYTYDEPATYSDFSGGINTDPSNEHLEKNEMRDCLNMHYNSAALVKRKGASLLCNIECEDELFNIQGVFLFTYKITYIIIAADGKLYKGFYSPNATIKLSRLPISSSVAEIFDVYNPLDTNIDLQERLDESLSEQHDGFLYVYTIDNDGNKINISDNFIGNYKDLPNGTQIKTGDITEYNGVKYKSLIDFPLNKIYPDTSKNWITIDNYNTTYAAQIITRTDPLSNYYKSPAFIEQQAELIDDKWQAKDPGFWEEKYTTWNFGDIVKYHGTVYICMTSHINYNEIPTETSPNWSKIFIKKELLFQNYKNIEAATYNNKMYFATGTRFVQVEIANNELTASVVVPYKCGSEEIVNIGFNYLSPYPELCRETRYNQVITSISGLLVTKTIGGKYFLQPIMNFANNETENDYYFKWEKRIGSEWYTIYSYKDNIYYTKNFEYIESIDGDYVKHNNIFFPINNPVNKWDLYRQEYNSTNNTYTYIKDSKGDYISIYDPIDKELKYYKLSFISETLKDIDYSGPRYKLVVTGTTINKQNLFMIEVDDADQYQYRVSFAKSFEQPSELVSSTWNYSNTYKVGDKISITDENNNTTIYRCIKSHNPRQILWDNVQYLETDIAPLSGSGLYYKTYATDNNGNYIPTKAIPTFSKSTTARSGNSLYTLEKDNTYKYYGTDTNSIIAGDTYWEEDYIEEGIVKTDASIDYDWVVNKVDGEYFGSVNSIIYEDINVNDTYKIIQSCTKITSDGNKFLLYGDKYNSGSWYKTIINNPSYITDRGNLSFKTNKNEELIKVIPFNGNLIAFANAENVGGSIHLITGNGDDYDANDGYYSPYRRSIINVNISCDNANTVQVCENILVFKYFNNLYYISSSDLTNEVVSVYSCNDKIKHNNNNFVTIPWDDNSCISEVTEDYYAIIWKEKYSIDGEDLILERPALKIKMYYKLGTQQNEKIVFPWLRDESQYFNIDHIVYIKGKPVYLYNNTLTTFNEEVYTDYGKNYKCLVHFRGEDLNYPKMYKLINNVLIYYHRNQYSKLDFNLLVKNEAGHKLLDSSVKKFSINDLRALKAGDKVIDGDIRLDSTILDSKVFNTDYKFPCLLADSIITAENDKEFSISSITYNYTTSETPDTTSYDLYTNILRPKEVK